MSSSLSALVAAEDSPPLSVAVIEAFDRITTSGVSEASLFQAGSIAKPVAALVALQLVEDGVLDLDRPVNDRLRTWRIPGGANVTLRRLLTHTAGIGVPFFLGYGAAERPPDLADVLDGAPPANTTPVRVEEPPGEFRYSGGGYVVVQQLIVDATGESFASAAERLVLGRLSMTDSTFEQPPPARVRDHAIRQDWNVYPEAAAAGLWTTARDLATFTSAIQRAAAGRPSPVSAGVARAMIAPSTALPAEGEWNVLPSLGLRAPDHYGMGFFLEGGERFSHLGGAHGFYSLLTASTQDGTGAVIMSAADPTPRLFEVALALSDTFRWEGFRSPETGSES